MTGAAIGGIVAALIAFLLNPIVRALTRVWIPRGFGVALVYLSFVAIAQSLGNKDAQALLVHRQSPEVHAWLVERY